MMNEKKISGQDRKVKKTEKGSSDAEKNRTKDRISDLQSADTGRLMLRLAVPTVTAQIVNMLYNIVDRIYIGHMPDVGSDALTGVGLCFPILTLISAFASLLWAEG